MKIMFWGVVMAMAAVLFPVLQQAKVTAKRETPAMRAQSIQEDARIGRALTALRRGDVTQQAEVRSVMSSLRKGDFRRTEFAKLLADRGETRAAFELERTRVHFLEDSVPDDKEMAFYAGLARQIGDAEEGAWALDRIGPDGHFRAWKRLEERLLSPVGFPDRWGYEQCVNRHMDNGLELFPAFRDEIEAMRHRLLDTTGVR